MTDPADSFDPFETALLVRDAVADCSCCDEQQSEERFSAAAELLAWVVRTRERLAVLEALVGGGAEVDPVIAPKRRPLTPAERQQRRRLRKAGKLPPVERHGARDASRKVTAESHENVTDRDGVDVSLPSCSSSSQPQKNSENLSSNGAKNGAGSNQQAQEDGTQVESRNVTKTVTEERDSGVTDRDAGESDGVAVSRETGSQNFTSEVRAVFEHWLRVMGKDAARAKLTDPRRARIKARLREGYTVEQLCSAIDGCRRSAWHMGENDRGEPYNDLETILRSGKTVEQHIARAEHGGSMRRSGRGMAPVSADFDDSENPEWARGAHG